MTTSTAACAHCGSPVAEGAREAPYCCRGCKEVHALLQSNGLLRYYDLAGGQGVPVSASASSRSLAWLEPLVAASEGSGARVCQLELDIQGLHCAACVWLINELFRRREGGAAVTVNPALGKVRLAWERGRFDLAEFVAEVERFGYQFGPSRKAFDKQSKDLPLRIGICAALTMNVMMFAVSFYVGLAPSDGELFTLFTRLTVGLSALVVAIGGWPFFKTAWEGLRRGVLHLDLPIAAGILLAFGTSLAKARDGRGDLAYFDTVDTFVTLMLVGRWLQRRVIDRNRRFLLEDAGIDGLHVRRKGEERLEAVSAGAVRVGDELLLAPGDLVPMDSELLDGVGQISTDWINGESTPRAVGKGDVLPAGSFNAGRSALVVRAKTTLADSPLPGLLRAGDGAAPGHVRLVEGISRVYVPVVLCLAALGFFVWWPMGAARALDVTVALLVVTCPCALGLALPLAFEVALAQLRRKGVFVRAGDLLDRVLKVKQILFDKTGTLTLGRLELTNPEVVAQLAEDERDALYAMAARSNHPASRCLAEEAARAGARFWSEVQVDEVPGSGLELAHAGVRYRLGRPSWVAGSAEGQGEAQRGEVAFGREGTIIARFTTRESMRPDAAEEMAQLRARGLDVWLVSGDAPERVQAAARQLGIPAERALAAQRPEDKARTVARLDAKNALFLGDGVNDALAFQSAFATGSPAVDRPVMPGKADFFLLGEGIGGVRTLFEQAQVLRGTVRRVLFLALAYNSVAIAVCLLGVMTPLRAAVAMPLSTISVLALAVTSLSRRDGAAPAQGSAERSSR